MNKPYLSALVSQQVEINFKETTMGSSVLFGFLNASISTVGGPDGQLNPFSNVSTDGWLMSYCHPIFPSAYFKSQYGLDLLDMFHASSVDCNMFQQKSFA